MQDFNRVSEEDQEAQAMKMLQGQFNYKDFYKQIEMIQKMGSLKDIMAKLPMQDMLPKDANVDDKELVRIKAMIDSMTEKERIGFNPLDESRMTRISKGSGRSLKEVKELNKKFLSMKKMMGGLGKNLGGLMGKIPGMGGLNQMNNLRKMAKNAGMGAMGGGMPDMGSLANMFGGMGAGGSSAPRTFDRDKQKKMRKAAKKARKKNRKK